MRFTVVAVLCLLVLGASAHPFTQCGSADHLHLSSVTLNPDEPVPGSNLQVQLAGKADQTISGGTATLKVSVLGITIDTIKFDLCKQLNLTCPVTSSFMGQITYPIPSAAPSGISAKCEISVTDSSGAALDCVDLKVTIGKKSEGQFSALERSELEFLFEAWREEHKIEYASAAEYVKRMDVFASNHLRIVKHNALGLDWVMAHNEFSADTWEEFRATKLGFGTVPRVNYARVNAFAGADVSNLADSVDWTTKGAVTPVKNQGQCGSCWSFSTTGGLEGAYAIKTGNLKSFSEEQLVDCDHTDSGCQGGLMDNAFEWIKKNGGICLERDYPYTSGGGTAGSCQRSCSIVPGTASGHKDIAQSTAALQAALSQQPVSIAIEADQSGFQFYSSGVFSGSCGTQLDHGVLAVGYGTENGMDYWKVKNSWGATWGSAGYIKFQKGKAQSGGQCGILLSASIAVL